MRLLNRVRSVRTAKLLAGLVAATAFISGIMLPAANAQVLLDSASSDAVQSKLPLYEWHDSDAEAQSAGKQSIVVTVHGATQEACCFDKLARNLAKQGFLVCSMDLRGHGLWHFRKGAAARAKKSPEGFNCDYKQSVVDLEHLLDTLRASHPGAPIFCIGESAGAGVIVKAGIERPDAIKGMVLASAGTHPVMHKLSVVFPDLLKGFKNIAHPLEIKRYITRYSSDDPRVTKEMNEDPLGRHTMSGRELLATSIFIRDTASRAKELPSNIPLLVLQGTEDQVCSPTSVRAIVGKHPGFDKQLVFLKNCGHVLLGTSFIKPQVNKLVVDWLKQHRDTALAAKSVGPLALNTASETKRL
jgi:alpha-beta hydrolase superfamily lysophospholipase